MYYFLRTLTKQMFFSQYLWLQDSCDGSVVFEHAPRILRVRVKTKMATQNIATGKLAPAHFAVSESTFQLNDECSLILGLQRAGYR